MSREQDFWARRRAGVAAEAQAEEAAVAEQALKAEHAAFEDMDEAELLDALDLPDPDTLIQGDDFSVFMAKAVPDHIRRRALRTLWRSNPVLANLDALVDYGEDYTDAAMAVDKIQTAYQVGKGMLKHVEEMARQAEERANPSAPAEVIDASEDMIVAEVADDTTADVAPAVTMTADVRDATDMDTDYAALTPRRMKFRIEETA